MDRRSRIGAWLGRGMPVLLMGLGACLSPPVQVPITHVEEVTPIRVQQSVKDKVDILFLIDNSPSMRPKQTQLRAVFGNLIKKLDDFGVAGNKAWYHIGVVTSDLGAGNSTLCVPVGGDGAKLNILNRSAGQMPSTWTTCPLKTQAQGARGTFNFIDYNQKDHTNDNIVTGQTLETTFSCIAAVDAWGCGLEHQLEAAYRALHDKGSATDPDNHDFFRDDALLVVVFLTDEDDCSAAPNTPLFQNTTMWAGNISYACNQYGVVCNYGGSEQLMPFGDSGGPLMSCRAAPNPVVNGIEQGPGKLYDVSRYTNFFTQPKALGGAKFDPNDVLLFGILAFPDPVQSILAAPYKATAPNDGPFMQCAGPVNGVSCVVTVQHSCINPTIYPPATYPTVFGDPAVRVAQVINSIPGSSQRSGLASVCDFSGYGAALDKLGDQIISNLKPGCLTSPVANAADPDCLVEDVTINANGTTTVTEVPSCARNNHTVPCWQLKPDPQCCPVAVPPACDAQQYGIVIDRGMGVSAPPGTYARVNCSTVPHSSCTAINGIMTPPMPPPAPNCYTNP